MTKTPLRRRSRRAASAIFATVVAGGAMATWATAAGATASADETPLQLETFDAAGFGDQASDLPPEMVDAIERDLGISAEEYLANAATAKAASDVVADLESDGVGVEDAAIDGQDLKIYVDGESEVDAAEATGADVEVGAPDTIDPDSFGPVDFTFDNVKGGTPYVWSDAAGEEILGGCSTGFNGSDAGGDPLVYTAGHCGNAQNEDGSWEPLPSDSTWHKRDVDGPLYGGWWDEEPVTQLAGGYGVYAFGKGHDGGYNTVTEGGALPPEVLTWGGGSGGPDSSEALKIYDAIKPMKGQEVCKSGGTTGWTCGEILEGDYTTEIAGKDINTLVMNACMQGGDSGGATVVGNYAVGVDSWGSTLPEGTYNYCKNWDPRQPDGSGQHASGSYALVGNSTNLADYLGEDFNLSIFVGAPKVENPGAEATTKPTFRGTANAAEGAEVKLHLSGPDSRTLVAKVGADGKWSVQPNKALPEGDYTYTASTSHTAKASSNKTVSEEVSGSFSAVKPPVEQLTVGSPSDNQTVASGNARPAFTGTGHPGATVTLTAGDKAYGEAKVDGDGTWKLVPGNDLPVGVRFDAVLTQSAEGETQSVTVANIGVKVNVALTNPEAGAEVTGDVVFTGTAHPDAEVGLLLQPKDASSNAPAAAAGPAPADEDVDEWKGEFKMDEKGNWTFTPAEPVALDDYTVTANARTSEEFPGLAGSDAVSFTVVEDDNGDDGDDDGGELPDTGSNTTPLILLGIGLLAAGGTIVGFRTFRGRSIA